ncbi:uncharacterized protein MONOS_8945 [Monocercomonoides exilis]|uniref:uncharacterized protein n=1 Tax=Monocercomonoides exilis TaxID=2049356 RepID=UPI0035598B5B|nr:hypothetical protein MONOS_8945 [Monocercomonoides exilis]|eukprot:MONOS_8945.1-p1 / transcript=MONOS_8945.1 / gene=MONOS_8945 / organism=Monocercomonoides_exilis_PA203 / gene_product=unspecified product / transcript_product=unspecified product / location=Mono_scaffold00352:51718-58843(+) / protein_length=2252 / sequence_SO=supercontig / SO=protein_coding / is_pseudo=false
MIIRKVVFDWLHQLNEKITDDGPGPENGTICLSALSSMLFQNGVHFFELFQVLAQKTDNGQAQQQLLKTKIVKSQARIAIMSNYSNLAPLFRLFNVNCDSVQCERIADSDEEIVAQLLDALFCSVVEQSQGSANGSKGLSGFHYLPVDYPSLNDELLTKANTCIDLLILIFENSFRLRKKEIVELMTDRIPDLQALFVDATVEPFKSQALRFFRLCHRHTLIFVTLSQSDPPSLSFLLQIESLGLRCNDDAVLRAAADALTELAESAFEADGIKERNGRIKTSIASTANTSYPLAYTILQWFNGVSVPSIQQFKEASLAPSEQSGCAVLTNTLHRHPLAATHLASLLLCMGQLSFTSLCIAHTQSIFHSSSPLIAGFNECLVAAIDALHTRHSASLPASALHPPTTSTSSSSVAAAFSASGVLSALADWCSSQGTAAMADLHREVDELGSSSLSSAFQTELLPLHHTLCTLHSLLSLLLRIEGIFANETATDPAFMSRVDSLLCAFLRHLRQIITATQENTEGDEFGSKEWDSGAESASGAAGNLLSHVGAICQALQMKELWLIRQLCLQLNEWSAEVSERNASSPSPFPSPSPSHSRLLSQKTEEDIQVLRIAITLHLKQFLVLVTIPSRSLSSLSLFKQEQQNQQMTPSFSPSTSSSLQPADSSAPLLSLLSSLLCEDSLSAFSPFAPSLIGVTSLVHSHYFLSIIASRQSSSSPSSSSPSSFSSSSPSPSSALSTISSMASLAALPAVTPSLLFSSTSTHFITHVTNALTSSLPLSSLPLLSSCPFPIRFSSDESLSFLSLILSAFPRELTPLPFASYLIRIFSLPLLSKGAVDLLYALSVHPSLTLSAAAALADALSVLMLHEGVQKALDAEESEVAAEEKKTAGRMKRKQKRDAGYGADVSYIEGEEREGEGESEKEYEESEDYVEHVLALPSLPFVSSLRCFHAASLFFCFLCCRFHSYPLIRRVVLSHTQKTLLFLLASSSFTTAFIAHHQATSSSASSSSQMERESEQDLLRMEGRQIHPSQLTLNEFKGKADFGWIPKTSQRMLMSTIVTLGATRIPLQSIGVIPSPSASASASSVPNASAVGASSSSSSSSSSSASASASVSSISSVGDGMTKVLLRLKATAKQIFSLTAEGGGGDEENTIEKRRKATEELSDEQKRKQETYFVFEQLLSFVYRASKSMKKNMMIPLREVLPFITRDKENEKKKENSSEKVSGADDKNKVGKVSRRNSKQEMMAANKTHENASSSHSSSSSSSSSSNSFSESKNPADSLFVDELFASDCRSRLAVLVDQNKQMGKWAAFSTATGNNADVYNSSSFNSSSSSPDSSSSSSSKEASSVLNPFAGYTLNDGAFALNLLTSSDHRKVSFRGVSGAYTGREEGSLRNLENEEEEDESDDEEEEEDVAEEENKLAALALQVLRELKAESEASESRQKRKEEKRREAERRKREKRERKQKEKKEMKRRKRERREELREERERIKKELQEIAEQKRQKEMELKMKLMGKKGEGESADGEMEGEGEGGEEEDEALRIEKEKLEELKRKLEKEEEEQRRRLEELEREEQEEEEGDKEEMFDEGIESNDELDSLSEEEEEDEDEDEEEEEDEEDSEDEDDDALADDAFAEMRRREKRELRRAKRMGKKEGKRGRNGRGGDGYGSGYENENEKRNGNGRKERKERNGKRGKQSASYLSEESDSSLSVDVAELLPLTPPARFASVNEKREFEIEQARRRYLLKQHEARVLERKRQKEKERKEKIQREKRDRLARKAEERWVLEADEKYRAKDAAERAEAEQRRLERQKEREKEREMERERRKWRRMVHEKREREAMLNEEREQRKREGAGPVFGDEGQANEALAKGKITPSPQKFPFKTPKMAASAGERAYEQHMQKLEEERQAKQKEMEEREKERDRERQRRREENRVRLEAMREEKEKEKAEKERLEREEKEKKEMKERMKREKEEIERKKRMEQLEKYYQQQKAEKEAKEAAEKEKEEKRREEMRRMKEENERRKMELEKKKEEKERENREKEMEEAERKEKELKKEREKESRRRRELEERLQQAKKEREEKRQQWVEEQKQLLLKEASKKKMDALKPSVVAKRSKEMDQNESTENEQENDEAMKSYENMEQKKEDYDQPLEYEENERQVGDEGEAAENDDEEEDEEGLIAQQEGMPYSEEERMRVLMGSEMAQMIEQPETEEQSNQLTDLGPSDTDESAMGTGNSGEGEGDGYLDRPRMVDQSEDTSQDG